MKSYVTNGSIPVIPRLLLNAGIQFGVAGLGITIVCILRKKPFTQFGLIKRNLGKAIIQTILCFLPLIGYVFASGQFEGYSPFSILITKDVLESNVPVSIFGMAIIVVVWGFFRGVQLCRCERENQ